MLLCSLSFRFLSFIWQVSALSKQDKGGSLPAQSFPLTCSLLMIQIGQCFSDDATLVAKTFADQAAAVASTDRSLARFSTAFSCTLRCRNGLHRLPSSSRRSINGVPPRWATSLQAATRTYEVQGGSALLCRLRSSSISADGAC